MALLSSCAYSPKNLTPFFIDHDAMVCRQYKVVQTKPILVFEYVKEYPLYMCNNFVAFPIEQILEIKRAYNQSIQIKDDMNDNSTGLE